MSDYEVYNIEGVVVRSDTGEIITPDGDPAERLIKAGLEAKQQIDTWEKYYNACRRAAMSIVGPENPRLDTVSGVAKFHTRRDRTASPQPIPQLVEEYELNERQINLLFSCAKTLDPEALYRIPPEVIPSAVIDTLITVKRPQWVQFEPIKKQAPVPLRVEKE